MIKGAVISTRPETGDYVVTVGKKKYLAHTLRGCFKAANGRWPKDNEMDQFIELIAKGDHK